MVRAPFHLYIRASHICLFWSLSAPTSPLRSCSCSWPFIYLILLCHFYVVSFSVHPPSAVRCAYFFLFSWSRFCVLANQSSVSLVLAMIETSMRADDLSWALGTLSFAQGIFFVKHDADDFVVLQWRHTSFWACFGMTRLVSFVWFSLLSDYWVWMGLANERISTRVLCATRVVVSKWSDLNP